MAKWTVSDIADLSGRTAIVTGANSGLGLHTSKGLAGAGAKVIMACRSQIKAEAAAGEIRAEHPEAELEIRSLDLSRLDSIADFAAGIHQDGIKVDLLVNNAGIMAVPHAITGFGVESQIGTNHFGHFALTGQLFDALQTSARIVNVASLAHRFTPGINFEDLAWENRRYNRWQAYGDSKLANLLFTFELQRRLQAAASGITVAAAHPGYSDTHLQFVAAEQKQSTLENLAMKASNAIFAQPADMGALPSLYAATAGDVQSGDYIGPDGFQQMRGYPHKVSCRRKARDATAAQRLWEVSQEKTGVSFLG